MKNKSKRKLEAKGILAPRSEAWRTTPTPGAQAHADRRKPNRSAQKRALKRELQNETARNRGPFPFVLVFGFQAPTQALGPELEFCGIVPFSSSSRSFSISRSNLNTTSTPARLIPRSR